MPRTRLAGLLGRVLQVGVGVSAAVALVGGSIYLGRHGTALPEYGEFHGVPEGLDSVHGIVRGALEGRGRWITQLALLILITTPIARVALSAMAFLREGDRTYVAICLFVLSMLLVGLLAGIG